MAAWIVTVRKLQSEIDLDIRSAFLKREMTELDRLCLILFDDLVKSLPTPEGEVKWKSFLFKGSAMEARRFGHDVLESNLQDFPLTDASLLGTGYEILESGQMIKEVSVRPLINLEVN